MPKHINGLKKCSCGGYPKLEVRSANVAFYSKAIITYYKFVCPGCGKTSIFGNTVKEAKTNWNWNKYEK